ncbi:terminase small subunit [Limosilactobacillus reuteri]|uniref:terminase small subunit n=1 Tax=Limosilactobacillus reuteri TaxID=1598 RepID=UPI001E5C9A82|nr:terminase small subunit [Limosilactobacillus reuteri]MCC4347642.1 terminase small subunit [Limosilactobacillus reuteri]MCC4385983.1 terminase small subunit [Limosilactobacillus reuteri]
MSKMEEAKADYLAGMKYKDIAKKYGVALSTVKSWKTRNKWQRNNATKKKSMHTKVKSTRTKQEKVAPSLPPPELPDSNELNDKQKAFCLYYLQRYNATWAYQKAYGGSYENALAHGSRMVGNGRIKSYLTKLKKQQSQDLYATANDILLRYLNQATSNVTDVLSFRTEKHLAYYKVRDKNGPYEDGGGNFSYVPKIDPETGEQAYYYTNIVELKDSSEIDTSNIKSIRIDKGEPVVEMEDRQKAMQILLDRLPEPEVNDGSTNSLLAALSNGMKKIWSDKDGDKDS